MRRSDKKVKHVGFELRAFKLQQDGTEGWSSEGKFPTRRAANDHRKKHCAGAKKFTIMGLRVNIEPIQPFRAGSDTDGKAA